MTYQGPLALSAMPNSFFRIARRGQRVAVQRSTFSEQGYVHFSTAGRFSGFVFALSQQKGQPVHAIEEVASILTV
jgi:hypothetical protein